MLAGTAARVKSARLTNVRASNNRLQTSRSRLRETNVVATPSDTGDCRIFVHSPSRSTIRRSTRRRDRIFDVAYLPLFHDAFRDRIRGVAPMSAARLVHAGVRRRDRRLSGRRASCRVDAGRARPRVGARARAPCCCRSGRSPAPDCGLCAHRSQRISAGDCISGARRVQSGARVDVRAHARGWPNRSAPDSRVWCGTLSAGRRALYAAHHAPVDGVFIGIAMVSTVLFAGASMVAWSTFANYLALPLVAVMFIGEYACPVTACRRLIALVNESGWGCSYRSRPAQCAGRLQLSLPRMKTRFSLVALGPD